MLSYRCCLVAVFLCAMERVTSFQPLMLLPRRPSSSSSFPLWTPLQDARRRIPMWLPSTMDGDYVSPQSNNDNSSDNDSSSSSLLLEDFCFLGRGDSAIVRPGCVLVAPAHEYHHYYRRSAIFVHAMGEDPELDPMGETVFVIRGVILDHPTPFTLKEMMDHNPVVTNNPMGNNFLFRGGDKGQDGVILLHNQPQVGLGEQQQQTNDAIGNSGIYQGGWQAALAACAGGTADPASFKAFFNYCEFTEQELEDLMDSKDEDTGDAWTSVEVNPDFILDPDFDRGDAWSRLRNTIKQMNV